MKAYLVPDENLRVSKRVNTVLNALSASTTKLRTIGKLIQIIDTFAKVGILSDVVHTDCKFRFKFKNNEVKNCIWEGGSILELHTYQCEKVISDEWQVGVHLDWNSVVMSAWG